MKIVENKVQMLNFPLNWDDVRGAEDIIGKSWMPKRKDPKTKNVTHQRGFLTHPNHHPREIQGSNASGEHHVRQRNPLHRYHLKAPKIHDSGIHRQLRGNNTTIIQNTSQTDLHAAGFKITNILTNGKFACITGNILELQMNLNVCSNDDHVGDIERLNRTVKERG